MLRCLLMLLLTTLGAAREWSVQLPVSARPVQVLSPDGHSILMGDTFGPLLIFDVETGTISRALPMPTRRLYSLGWLGQGILLGDPDAPDARAILVVSEKGKSRRLPGGVHQVLASPSGRFVASISYDTLWLADRLTGKRIQNFEPPFKTWRLAQSDVRLLIWLPGDRLLAVRGGYGSSSPFEILRVDPKGLGSHPAIPLPDGFVASAYALDLKGGTLHLGSTHGQLLVVDLQTGRVNAERRLVDQPIVAMAWSGDGRLATWQGSHIRVWKAGLVVQAQEAFVSGGEAGWCPLLTWAGEDLVLAAQEMNGAWRAERREPKLKKDSLPAPIPAPDPGS